VTGFDISPSVADHKTRRKIDCVFDSRIQQEPRLRFAALAPILIVVVTNIEFVDGQCMKQISIDRFNDFGPLLSPRNVRLVGDADEHESVTPQGLQCRQDIGRNFQIIKCVWWPGLSFFHYRPIEHSVSIKKNRPAQVSLHRTDSHLV
jgi:hypothetical protein